jgi:hypothetical protein
VTFPSRELPQIDAFGRFRRCVVSGHQHRRVS